jgi:hypothetical protein
MMTMETKTVWTLANMVEMNPASSESVGARWLLLVQMGVGEVLQQVAEGYDRSDAVHEVADGMVPVYTHEVWEVFTDLGAWTVSEDANELCDASTDMEQRAKVCLYVIAERLLVALLEGAGAGEES